MPIRKCKLVIIVFTIVANLHFLIGILFYIVEFTKID